MWTPLIRLPLDDFLLALNKSFKKQRSPQEREEKVSMTFLNVFHSLCHGPVVSKLIRESEESNKQKLPWCDTERVLYRTTQPLPHPSPKCMESHTHKDACFPSSQLNKKQKLQRQSKAKLPWWQGLQSFSLSCQRGGPAREQHCTWVSRWWLSGISRNNKLKTWMWLPKHQGTSPVAHG